MPVSLKTTRSVIKFWVCRILRHRACTITANWTDFFRFYKQVCGHFHFGDHCFRVGPHLDTSFWNTLSAQLRDFVSRLFRNYPIRTVSSARANTWLLHYALHLWEKRSGEWDKRWKRKGSNGTRYGDELMMELRLENGVGLKEFLRTSAADFELSQRLSEGHGMSNCTRRTKIWTVSLRHLSDGNCVPDVAAVVVPQVCKLWLKTRKN